MNSPTTPRDRFGLPSETRTDRWRWPSNAPAALVERDIDKAIQIARDAAKSNCFLVGKSENFQFFALHLEKDAYFVTELAFK